jgi:hypothetical protein
MKEAFELSELIEQGRTHVNKFAPSLIRAMQIGTPIEELKCRVWLAVQAMFPQLNEDAWSIIAELMTTADVESLGLMAALPKELKVTSAQRVKLWEVAREKFEAADILSKLSPVQLAFAQRFLLNTRE